MLYSGVVRACVIDKDNKKTVFFYVYSEEGGATRKGGLYSFCLEIWKGGRFVAVQEERNLVMNVREVRLSIGLLRKSFKDFLEKDFQEDFKERT